MRSRLMRNSNTNVEDAAEVTTGDRGREKKREESIGVDRYRLRKWQFLYMYKKSADCRTVAKEAPGRPTMDASRVPLGLVPPPPCINTDQYKMVGEKRKRTDRHIERGKKMR